MNKTMRRHIIFWIVYLIWDIIQIVLSLVMATEQPKNIWLVATYSGLADMFLKVILFYVLYYFVYKPAFRGLRPLYITVTATVAITLSFLFLQRVFMFYFVMPQLWYYNTFKLSFYRFYSMVVMLYATVPANLTFGDYGNTTAIAFSGSGFVFSCKKRISLTIDVNAPAFGDEGLNQLIFKNRMK
jgi:hypothetical protein